MDPKTSSSLDPKLKEVYDRVMGTSTTPLKTQTPPLASPQPTSPPVTTITSPLNSSQIPAPSAQNQSIPGQNTQTSHYQSSQPSFSSGTPFTQSTFPTKPLGAFGSDSSNTTSPFTGSTISPQTSTHTTNKTTMDYASIAAKYATPTPPIGLDPFSSAPRPSVVKPSTTTYGVVNNSGTKLVAQDKTENSEKKGFSGMKKILLFVGLPVFLIVYTIMWLVIFGVDITQLLPLS